MTGDVYEIFNRYWHPVQRPTIDATAALVVDRACGGASALGVDETERIRPRAMRGDSGEARVDEVDGGRPTVAARCHVTPRRVMHL